MEGEGQVCWTVVVCVGYVVIEESNYEYGALGLLCGGLWLSQGPSCRVMKSYRDQWPLAVRWFRALLTGPRCRSGVSRCSRLHCAKNPSASPQFDSSLDTNEFSDVLILPMPTVRGYTAYLAHQCREPCFLVASDVRSVIFTRYMCE